MYGISTFMVRFRSNRHEHDAGLCYSYDFKMGWCLILIGLLLRERPFATRLHEELLSQADATTL
jgi:hypothetical protein